MNLPRNLFNVLENKRANLKASTKLKVFLGLIFTLLVVALALQFVFAGGVYTGDASGNLVVDFAPGDIVYIYGSEFNASQNLVIKITRPDSSVNTSYVTTDEFGNFTYQYDLDGITGDYFVEVFDAETNEFLAGTAFTDCGSPQVCVNLSAVADSWVDEQNKNDNNGADAELHVKSQTGKNRMSFLKFDLSSIPSSIPASSITSAKLYVYKSGGDNQGETVYVNLVSDDSWTENGITWNNMPPYSTQCGFLSVGGTNTYYSWPVTSCVQGEYSGDKIISLVMRFGENNKHKDFYSKEQEGTNKDPYLEVCYSVQCTKDSDCPSDYYTCNGNSIIYHDTYCDTKTYTCKESISTLKDCDVKDGWYDTGKNRWIDDTQCTEKEQKEQEYRDYYCGGNPIDCYYTITGTQWVDTGNTRPKPLSTPCNDGLWCSAEDHCDGNGNCVQKTARDCSQYNIPGIATCDNNPDNYHPTWDFRAAFTSQCVEDGGNQGHCTTGSETITHTCNVEDCGAKCEKNEDCSSKCVGNTWNYGGTCQEDCTCKYTQQQDCDKLDCTTGIECVGIGTGEIQELGDDYSCGSNGCEVVGKKPCSKWICGSEECPSCVKKKCGEIDLICYETGGPYTLIWDTQPAPRETDCKDGYDNDCDGKIDCADSDCIGQTGPQGNLCCLSDANCNSFGAPYYYPEITTCDYIPDNYLPTFDYRQEYPGYCDTGTHECIKYTPEEISHTCADSDLTDSGPKVPSENGIRTCSAECDGYGTECQPKIKGDYCYYGGRCNTNPTACTCSYSNSQFCPVPGTVYEGNCYWGERSCTENGCGLTVTPMDCKNYCDPSSGPKDTIGPTTSNVAVTPYYNNGIFNLTAKTEDTCTVIKTAEYFVGPGSHASCDPNAPVKGTIYPADDGSFDLDKLIEYLLRKNIVFKSDGVDWACVKAQDNAGNWGNCACVYFEEDIIPPDCAYDIKLDNVLYPDEYLICGNNAMLNATVCDQESKIQGGEYFIDLAIPPIPDPWSGYWMDTTYNFTRWDGYKCAYISALVDASKLSDGTHYIRLRGKDTAENWGKISECLGVSFVRDTLAPETTKTLTPAGGVSHVCEQSEITEANLPKGVSLTDGCQFVKAGTTIKLHATDPDPQKTGEHADQTKIHWKVYYKVNPENEWTLDQKGVGEENQDVTITLGKDSYHLIEYWSVDACGWEEQHHYELDIVDEKAPVTTKTIGEPKIECGEDQGCDYWITQQTPITLSCVDQLPHPSDHVTVYWRYKVDNGDFTQWFEDKDGYVEFKFKEDSVHTLQYYCEDILGNSESIHTEIDKVDSVPPTTTKIYGQPLVTTQGGYPKWINSSTPITLTATDGGAVCAVGVNKIYWRNTLVPSSACLNYDSCQMFSRWIFGFDSGNNGSWGYVNGPATPPMGSGSAKFVVGDSSTGVTLSNSDQSFRGLKLSSITQLKYSTYVVSAPGPQTISLQLNIDYDCSDSNTGWQGRLIYEPYWTETVEQGKWQTWNPLNGKWWASGSPGNTKCPQSSPCTWSEVLSYFPNACIRDADYTGIVLKAGSGWAYFEGYVDALIINSDVYDFEYPYGAGWNLYEKPFHKEEESCHLIEYYSVDLLGNVEPVKKQCVYVENTPPVSTKALDGPKHECTEGEKTQYGFNDCWYITQQTQVKLSCVDQLPHPVDQVKIYYKIDWKERWGDNWQEGQWIEDSSSVTFTYPKDSYHKLTWYCVDALGNKEQEHVELDIVDTKAPVSEKTLGDPKHECTPREQALYYPQMPNPTDGCYFITQNTPITITCSDQDPHPVNHVKIYYKDWIVEQEEPGWTKVNDNSVTITKTEDSAHILKWYCIDELGNTETTHVEYDIVDTVPPTITKTIIGPQFYNETEQKLYIDGVTKIQVESTDPEPHPVDHVLCNWSYIVQETQQTGGDNNLVPPFNISFPEESTHVLTITCRDALGNARTDVQTYIVDKTAPTTTKTYGTPYVTYQGKEWINSSTPITLTVEDTGLHKSGIKETKYRITLLGSNDPCESNDVCQQQTGTGNWNTYTQPFKIAQESCHLIEYYSVDNVNKTEEVKKQCVYVENTPPISSKAIGEPKKNVTDTEICSQEFTDGCYFITQNTQVNLTCSDLGNHPVDQVKIYYKIDWKEKWEDNWQEGQWIEDSSSVTFTYPKDSYHKLTWYCVDALGNKEQEHVELDIVDTQAPISSKNFNGIAIPCDQLPCAVSGDCDYYITKNTSIELTCSDQQPHPVDQVKIYYRYFVDDVLKQNWTQYTAPIKYSEDSNHRLEWYCVDELGNTEQAHTEIDRVDTTPPVTTKTIGDPKWENGYWVTSNTQITLSTQDKETICASGPSKLYYRISWDKNCDDDFNDDGEQGLWQYVTVNTSTCELEKTLQFEGECLHQIEWYAVDALGNTEEVHIQQHKVDNTPPHILILKPVDGWYSDGEDIPIVALAEDLNNPKGPCEGNCGGLGEKCAVGIEDGAQCYAYLLDVLPEPKIVELKTEGTFLYNASAHECQGYATIPKESGIPDGVVILVVRARDRLGNEAGSLAEILRSVFERCGCDVYDMCAPKCVEDVMQDIITIWNLPKIGIDNHAPNVTITLPESNTLFGGEQVSISADVSDANDGKITSTITSGTPCYITIGGISLGTVPYNNENKKCQGTVMIPQDEDFPQDEQELTVKIADNAGNIGEGSISVIVDTVKPILNIIDPINNQFVQGVKQIKFTASDAHLNSANVMISTDNGQTWHSASGGPVTYTYNWDTTKETDGMAYGIIAKATDDAGNIGYSEQVIVIVDNGAPEGVYIVSPIKDEIVQGNLTLKALATDYVSGILQVQFYSNCGSWDAELINGVWQYTINTTTCPDGKYQVYALATDKLGHDTVSTSVPFIIDNNPPAKPTLYVYDPDLDGYDTDGTVTWYWYEPTDSGSGVDHYVIQINYINTKVYGTTFTYSDLVDANWYAKVKAVDKAGHESEWSDEVKITVDKIPPTELTIYADSVEHPPYDTNGYYEIGWNGGLDTNFDRYELYENGVKIYTGSLGNTLVSREDMSEGNHRYQVKAYDKAGHVTTSSLLDVFVDTYAPSITPDTQFSVPLIGWFVNFTITDLSPSSGLQVPIYTTDATLPPVCDFNMLTKVGYCYVFTVLGGGDWLEIKVMDNAGWQTTRHIERGVPIDFMPPEITDSGPSGILNESNVMLEVYTNEPATCKFDVASKSYETMAYTMTTGEEDGKYHYYQLNGLADGMYAYHVKCKDIAGNVMTNSEMIIFVVDTTGNYNVTINLHTGWNGFFLPRLVLEEIGSLNGDYSVWNVLSSIAGNYTVIWYYDGTMWKYYNPEWGNNPPPLPWALTEFNDQQNRPYWIYMTQNDRLEIE